MHPGVAFSRGGGLGLGLAIACALRSSPLKSPIRSPPSPTNPSRSRATANTGRKPGDALHPGSQGRVRRGEPLSRRVRDGHGVDQDRLQALQRPLVEDRDEARTAQDIGQASVRRGRVPAQAGHYGYGRYEAVLKASGAHGAISSFFTYTGAHVRRSARRDRFRVHRQGARARSTSTISSGASPIPRTFPSGSTPPWRTISMPSSGRRIRSAGMSTATRSMRSRRRRQRSRPRRAR